MTQSGGRPGRGFNLNQFRARINERAGRAVRLRLDQARQVIEAITGSARAQISLRVSYNAFARIRSSYVTGSEQVIELGTDVPITVNANEVYDRFNNVDQAFVDEVARRHFDERKREAEEIYRMRVSDKQWSEALTEESGGEIVLDDFEITFQDVRPV